MKSTLRFLRFILMFASITLFSCDKESSTPELSFKVDGSKVTCEGAEKVYGLYYLTQDKLSIAASNYIVTPSGGEEVYDLKFIIQHVGSLSELVNVEIPIQSSVSDPSTEMYISGYVRPNAHPAHYDFTDIYFKITRLKHNKINGTFYGNLKSTVDSSPMVLELGTFSDVSIETLQQ